MDLYRAESRTCRLRKSQRLLQKRGSSDLTESPDIQPELVYSQDGDPAILRDAVRHPCESLHALNSARACFRR